MILCNIPNCSAKTLDQINYMACLQSIHTQQLRSCTSTYSDFVPVGEKETESD